MEARSALNITREDLESISNELAEIYDRLCIGQGAKAYCKRETVADRESLEAINPRESDSAMINPTKGIGADRVAYEGLLIIIRDQLKDLKNAVDRNNLCTENRDDSSPGMESNLSPEAMLTIRNEQIATLRAVLKANKQTAETEMAKLKSKYENEKSIMCETMMKLRTELNALKRYEESFVSLRSAFAAKCEEFITQLADLQMQLMASEEDVKQLNMHILEVDFPRGQGPDEH